MEVHVLYVDLTSAVPDGMQQVSRKMEDELEEYLEHLCKTGGEILQVTSASLQIGHRYYMVYTVVYNWGPEPEQAR